MTDVRPRWRWQKALLIGLVVHLVLFVVAVSVFALLLLGGTSFQALVSYGIGLTCISVMVYIGLAVFVERQPRKSLGKTHDISAPVRVSLVRLKDCLPALAALDRILWEVFVFILLGPLAGFGNFVVSAMTASLLVMLV